MNLREGKESQTSSKRGVVGLKNQDMRTPSLLGIALLCLSASAVAAGMDNDTVSVEEEQNETSFLLQSCHVRNYGDWYKVGGYCMKYFNTPLSFPNAEFACRKKAPEGHLVSVHSHYTNTAVRTIVRKRNTSQWSVWLGGLQLFKSHKFIWTDGSRWNFQKWVPGEPNKLYNAEDCVEMYIQSSGQWNDLYCSTLRHFVCAFKWLKQQEPEA